MAGVKGRSGRRSHLEDKTAEEILTLSAKTIREALSPMPSGLYELDLQTRAEIASKIYVKAMPTKIDPDSGLEIKQIVQVYIPAESNRVATPSRTADLVSPE